MKKKVISMFLTACTVSVMVVGGGSNLVMADDAETVTLMGCMMRMTESYSGKGK